MKKIMATALAAICMMAMLTSCKEKYTEIMTIGGQPIPAGVYLLYQLDAYNEAEGKAEDKEKDVLKQEIEGEKAEAWIYNRALELCQQYAYTEKAFEEQGLTFSEEDIMAYDKQIKTAWETSAVLCEKNGIGEASFTLYAYNSYKLQKLYTTFTTREDWEISDDEAKEYLNSTYTKIEFVPFYKISLVDYTALPEETLAGVQICAESMMADLNAGTISLEDAVKKYVKDAYTLAGYEEVDVETAPESFIRTELVEKESTAYNEELVTALFAAELEGEYAVSSQESYFMVWRKVANYEDDAAFALLKSSIDAQIKDDAFYDNMKEIYGAYSLDVNAAAVKHYAPKNIVVAA